MMILLSACNPAGTVNPQRTPISIFTRSITIDSVKASNGTATIAWTGSTDAQSYTVKYGTASGVYTTTVSTNATSPLIITGLTNGSSYFILVTEVQKTGKTVDATPVGVTPIDPFTLSSITASNQQATLVFPAVVGASAYTVKYGTSNGVYNNVATNTATSPYVVTGLTNGVTYYFMVTATNSNNGSQDASSALAAIPTAPTTLPSGVIASSSTTGQIVLNWNAATAATSYNVKRSTFSGGGYSTVGSLVVGTTFTDTTALNGTRYFYVVTSNAPGGESAISNEANSMSIASFTTLAAAVTTSGQVNLTWTGPTGATAYDVKYRIPGTNYSTFATVTSSSSTVTSLSTGTAYEFLVTAKNTYSGTLNSNAVTATTLSSASVSTSALSESAKIDWTAVVGSTSYDIMYGSVSGTYTTTLVNQNQATGVTVAGLAYTAPGPTYYVKVRAYTAAGYVDSAEYPVTVLPPVPAAPVVTAVVSNVVNLSWPVGGNLGSLRYSVLRNGVALTACTSMIARSCIDTTAVAGTTYTYTVTATNEGGTSPASTNIVAKTIASFNITNVVLDPTTANQAIVTWSTPTGADAAVYTVKYTTVRGDYTTPANVTTVSTAASSGILVTGLPVQTVYFMVTATNTPVGLGAVSAAKNATSDFAAVPVGAPALNPLTPGINSLTAVWGAVTGATSYDILYSSSVDPATTYTIYNVTSGYVLTGLGYGSDQVPTQYTVFVRANNLNGGVLSAGRTSPVIYPTFMRPGYLPAEGGVNKITIKWSPSTGQGTITYTVKRSTAVDGTYTDLAGCIALSALTLSCVDNTATAGTTFFYVVYANESLVAAPFTQANTSAYSSQIVFAQSIAQPTIATPEIRGEADALYVTYPTVAGGQTYSLAGGAGTATPAGAQTTGSTIHYTGLTGGTTYNFVLTVTNTITANIAVNGVLTPTTNVTTVTSGAAQPGVPLGNFTWPTPYTATSPLNPLTGTTANLVWNASAGAANYDIVYSSATHSGLVTYNLATYPAPYSALSPVRTSVTSPTTITATGTPDAGGVYYLRAIAKNAYGYLFSVDELTTGVWTFTGISSIDQVTTSSMRINWTAHPQASYYKIYMEQLAPSAVAPILLPSSTTQASNSYTVNGLTSGAQYRFSVHAVDANNMVDANANTLVQTAFRATAPTAITLQNPNLLVSSATANTGLENRPTFRVSGVTATHIIKLYEDSACATTVVGSATAAGATVDITITTALANPGTARPYVHTYYATAEPPANGNGPTGAVSTCSVATGTYNYYPCLTGYAPVPGNATLGSNPFCVMQFEARNVAGVATSTETGSPWTGVTATQAKTYCNQISTTTARNYDLISNPEWMTIARNMEAVGANWYGGVVNTNSMWGGNFAGIGPSCSYADRLLPVVDVSHATAAIITTDSYDQVCGNASWNYQTKRTLALANGYTIWDMAGNAGEITEWTTNRSPVNTIAAFANAPVFAGCPVGWEPYNAIGSMSVCAQSVNAIQAMLPSNTATSQAKRHGLFYGGTTGVAVRGGSYLNADTYTGIYALDFSTTPSAATTNIGFRCVDRP